MQNQTTRPIASISVDAQILIKRLQKASVGEVITYQELSALIERDTAGAARYCLATAMRALLREGVAFGAVRKTGVKRLENAEIADLGPEAIKRMRGKARRTLKKMSTADFEKLTDSEKIRFNVSTSVLHAWQEGTRLKNLTLIEAKAAEANDKLSMAATLELFAK